MSAPALPTTVVATFEHTSIRIAFPSAEEATRFAEDLYRHVRKISLAGLSYPYFRGKRLEELRAVAATWKGFPRAFSATLATGPGESPTDTTDVLERLGMLHHLVDVGGGYLTHSFASIEDANAYAAQVALRTDEEITQREWFEPKVATLEQALATLDADVKEHEFPTRDPRGGKRRREMARYILRLELDPNVAYRYFNSIEQLRVFLFRFCQAVVERKGGTLVRELEQAYVAHTLFEFLDAHFAILASVDEGRNDSREMDELLRDLDVREPSKRALAELADE